MATDSRAKGLNHGVAASRRRKEERLALGLLTTYDAAKHCGVGEHTILAARWAKELSTVEYSGLTLYERPALDKWMAERAGRIAAKKAEENLQKEIRREKGIKRMPEEWRALQAEQQERLAAVEAAEDARAELRRSERASSFSRARAYLDQHARPKRCYDCGGSFVWSAFSADQVERICLMCGRPEPGVERVVVVA